MLTRGLKGLVILGAMLVFSGGRAENVTSVSTNWSHEKLLDFGSTGGSSTTLVRASVSTEGVEGLGHSGYSPVSADGRFVVFTSSASNLVPGDSNGRSDIFVRDLLADETSRVSVSSAGVEANGGSYYPAISGDGRFIAFHSDADNLVAGDGNGAGDVFVHDRGSGTTERVSVWSDGAEGNSVSGWASISGDGRFVTFVSVASNWEPLGYPAGAVYLRDRALKETARVSLYASGQPRRGDQARISMDGRFIAFITNDGLVPEDTNGGSDAYRVERGVGVPMLVSVSTAGAIGVNRRSDAGLDRQSDAGPHTHVVSQVIGASAVGRGASLAR